ncbi:MAG: hypothetical protein DRO18_07310 [Thermoprotei archaeon]|nr:MAG: hypothetical protein DRO18_07310 [Thermoprotei archaeon]
MSRRTATLLVIFAPFLINLAASFVIYSTIPPDLWRIDPSEAMKVLYSRIYSYQSMLMVAVQLAFGLSLLHFTEGLYDLKPRDALLVLGLVILSIALFSLESLASSLLYHTSYSEYGRWFREVISMTPTWARYMNALVAPFTAGVFEEVIWRGYGITRLEEFMSRGKVVLVQAAAFALWHISPIHVLFVFPIGLAYGYAFVRRRSLAPLMAAHVVTDLIGFSVWLLA